MLLSVGLKDEKNNTYGSCAALGLIQKETDIPISHSNGLSVGVNNFYSYNEETIYTSSSCLNHNTNKILEGLFNSLYNQKSDLEMNLLKQKLQLNYKSHIINESEQETIMKLMMRRKTKDENMIPQLNEYIKSTILKGNAIIVANGIVNHDNIVEKVKQLYSKHMEKDEKQIKEKQLEYLPLNHYITTDNKQIGTIQLLFPSVGWSSPLMPILIVIGQMFGSAQMFSIGGPGKGIFSRSYLNILSKKNYISACSCINFHHSTFGVFGLSFDYFENYQEVIKDMIGELKKLLEPISNEELTRTKLILKRKILTNLSNNVTRCEETAKSVFYFNKIMHTEFIDLINQVTSNDINNTMRWILGKKNCLGLIMKGAENTKQSGLVKEEIIKLL